MADDGDTKSEISKASDLSKVGELVENTKGFFKHWGKDTKKNLDKINKNNRNQGEMFDLAYEQAENGNVVHEVWENQRWSAKYGNYGGEYDRGEYGDAGHLMESDPSPFSNRLGCTSAGTIWDDLEDIECPDGWEWEDDWQIDTAHVRPCHSNCPDGKRSILRSLISTRSVPGLRDDGRMKGAKSRSAGYTGRTLKSCNRICSTIAVATSTQHPANRTIRAHPLAQLQIL